MMDARHRHIILYHTNCEHGTGYAIKYLCTLVNGDASLTPERENNRSYQGGTANGRSLST